jgi:hypothetical protein
MANKIRLVDYIAVDTDYQNPALKSIIGEGNNATHAIETLDPKPVESGVPFLAVQEGPNENPNAGPDAPETVNISQDQVVHSYVYGGSVRLFMGDTFTPDPEIPSERTRYSLLVEPRSPDDFFAVLARDILLSLDGVNGVAVNPHGFVQIGETLLFGGYDDGKIYRLGANELNGLAPGSTHILRKAPLDLRSLAGVVLPINAHLQTMFYATDPGGNKFIFVVFIVYDVVNEEPVYTSSILIRLAVTVDPEGEVSVAFSGKVETQPNAQDLFLVKNQAGVDTLLIQAVGGKQQNGTTNGILSGISGVPAFADWTSLNGYADIMLTGDPKPAAGVTPTVYDIQDGACYCRGSGSDEVIISTGMYHAFYEQYNKQVYKLTAAQLPGFRGTTISQARIFGLEDFKDPEEDMDGGVRDMFIEPGDTAAADRLWERDGGKLTISSVADPDNHKIYGPGMEPEDIGGKYINSVSCTYLAVEEVEKGMTVKRTLRGGALPESMQGTGPAAGEEEEEEEEET